ncbi:rhomboid family intramembrane serine protease GlpG [Erwinia sp. CPCC 100877]|nr:rhomboid family intramembrane serine protease GlpG [Erwinia sp. CPCC 100877]
MLMITSFDNPRVAQAFVDYMATQGVVLTIEQHARSDVWLADPHEEARVREALAHFLEHPEDPRYLAASWQTGQTDTGLRYQRYPFMDTLRQRAGPLTFLVIAACIAVFILMQVVGDRTVMLWLAWPFEPALKYELWRYFTHALLHFSLLHILFNLVWWWYLGGPVEKRLGTGKLLVLTLISALLSGFIQHKFSGPWFGGLSGVVYALMGYVWLRGERDPDSGVQLPRGLIAFALIWLIAGWFDLFGLSIANGAHVTGLLVGLAMALMDTLHARKRT